jgi:hypothetical protein
VSNVGHSFEQPSGLFRCQSPLPFLVTVHPITCRISIGMEGSRQLEGRTCALVWDKGDDSRRTLPRTTWFCNSRLASSHSGASLHRSRIHEQQRMHGAMNLREKATGWGQYAGGMRDVAECRFALHATVTQEEENEGGGGVQKREFGPSSSPMLCTQP